MKEVNSLLLIYSFGLLIMRRVSPTLLVILQRLCLSFTFPSLSFQKSSSDLGMFPRWIGRFISLSVGEISDSSDRCKGSFRFQGSNGRKSRRFWKFEETLHGGLGSGRKGPYRPVGEGHEESWINPIVPLPHSLLYDPTHLDTWPLLAPSTSFSLAPSVRPRKWTGTRSLC